MDLDYNFVTDFIDEQKSVFEKEKHSISNITSIIILEFRSSMMQTASICAFIITILFGEMTFNWISAFIGQLLVIITILISAVFIFTIEFFRKQFLIRQIELSNIYDNSLWMLSELKRNIMTNEALGNKFEYRIFYFFIFCVICSERTKISAADEKLLKIKLFKLKTKDFQQFYFESEDIIKQGKTTLETFSSQFESKKYKPLVHLLKPLKNYKSKS